MQREKEKEGIGGMTLYYKDGKIVGEKIGLSFVKKVQYSKHFFRRGDAWGIDLEIFNKASAAGCRFITIKDTENNIVYTTTFDIYKKHGFVLDYGEYGEQIFLKIKWCSINNKNQTTFKFATETKDG